MRWFDACDLPVPVPNRGWATHTHTHTLTLEPSVLLIGILPLAQVLGTKWCRRYAVLMNLGNKSVIMIFKDKDAYARGRGEAMTITPLHANTQIHRMKVYQRKRSKRHVYSSRITADGNKKLKFGSEDMQT